MLFLQKAIYEGALSLLFQATTYQDRSLHGPEEEREKYHLLLEMLTPMVKTYPSEKGRQAVDNGLQVLGGYGFCSDFVLQQHLRDIRIFSIYEGTTGIQSLDLLGRKVTMQNGKAFKLLVAEMQHTMEAAAAYPALQPYVQALGAKMKLAQQVLGKLLPFAQQGQYERFLADATIFMEFFSTLTIAWQWLKMGVAAKVGELTNDGQFSADYYESVLHTMRFYFTYELPRMEGQAPILMNDEELTLLKEKVWVS
jgi:butyryl-CoA dehydrogenase